MTVIAQRYTQQSVGKRVAGTKVRYSWDFLVDRKPCQIVMMASYWSSKRILTFDGRLMFQGLKAFRRAFTYTFGAKGHLFRVEEANKSVEMFIDETPFTLLSSQASDLHEEAEDLADASWTPPLIEKRRGRLEQILHLMLQPDFLEIDSPGKKRGKQTKPKVPHSFDELETCTDALKFASSSTRQRFINASTFNRGRSPVQAEAKPESNLTNWKNAKRQRHSSVPSQSLDLLGFDTELTTIRHERKASPSPRQPFRADNEVEDIPTPLQKSLYSSQKPLQTVSRQEPQHTPRQPPTQRKSMASLDMFNTSPDIFAMPAYSPKAAAPRTKLDFEATFNTVY